MSSISDHSGSHVKVVAYFSQVLAIFVVIVACIINLSLGDDKSELWSSLLSGALGYLLPNPKLGKNDSFLPNPTIQQFPEILPKQHSHELHDQVAEDYRTGWTVGDGISRNVLREDLVHGTEG